MSKIEKKLRKLERKIRRLEEEVEDLKNTIKELEYMVIWSIMMLIALGLSNND